MPRKGPRTGNLDTQDGFKVTFLSTFFTKDAKHILKPLVSSGNGF